MAEKLNAIECKIGIGDKIITTFMDFDGAGILIKPSSSNHKIGEYAIKELHPGIHKPENGEIYLKFTKRDSLLVLIEAAIKAYFELKD